MDHVDGDSDDEHLRLQLIVITNRIGSAMRSQARVILLSEPGIYELHREAQSVMEDLLTVPEELSTHTNSSRGN